MNLSFVRISSPQVRIAEGDNTAQYWPNPGSQESAIVIGPVSLLHRSSAGPTTEAFFDCLNLPTFSRNLAQYRPYTKPIVIFTIASSCCCAENKCWRPELGPALAAKCIPELSFQQRHDIGSRSSANFWRCWTSVGPYLISHLGHYLKSRNIKKIDRQG